jgi:hypothetical protein
MNRTFMYREPGGAIIIGGYHIGDSEDDKLHDIGAEIVKAGYKGVNPYLTESGGVSFQYDENSIEGSYLKMLISLREKEEKLPAIKQVLEDIERLYEELRYEYSS